MSHPTTYVYFGLGLIIWSQESDIPCDWEEHLYNSNPILLLLIFCMLLLVWPTIFLIVSKRLPFHQLFRSIWSNGYIISMIKIFVWFGGWRMYCVHQKMWYNSTFIGRFVIIIMWHDNSLLPLGAKNVAQALNYNAYTNQDKTLHIFMLSHFHGASGRQSVAISWLICGLII
jgi:energy-coupling factor transporter transmembrane protein EcfT